MYKIANNVAPIYLIDLFQMRGNANNLNNTQLKLRSMSNRNFLIPKPKIKLKTVFPIPVLLFGIAFHCG